MSDAENDNADEVKDEEVVDEPEAEPEEKKKPKKKKEKAPKEKRETPEKLKEVEEQFTKWGYVDFWDYLTLIAGGYGLAYSIVNFFMFTAGFLGWSPNNQIVALFTYGIIFLIYAVVMIFPFVAKLIVKKLKPKASGLFPFEALKTQEDYRQFIAVIGCITALLLTFLEPNVGSGLIILPTLLWTPRLAHLPVMVVLWIVIYAESFRKKIPKLPPNKPVVD